MFNNCRYLDSITTPDMPDLSNVNTVASMFKSCKVLSNINNINNWDVSNVTNMSDMFRYVINFNQPIGNWDVSNVTNMGFMFQDASNFNQSIVTWILKPNFYMTNIFQYSGIKCDTYTSILQGWATNINCPNNRYLGTVNLKYTPAAVTYRNYLQNVKGWYFIYDTLMSNNCLPIAKVVFNDTACNVYNFNGQLLTQSGTYYDTTNNINGNDTIFILHLTISGLNYSINQTSCNAYYFNGQLLTQSGIYYDTLINANGCDSIITLDLMINYVDTSVTIDGIILTANAVDAKYQWMRCNPYEMIKDTQRILMATSNSDYAVIITQNNCIDTSYCYRVTDYGKDNTESINSIKIYPNPVKDELIIETDIALQNVDVKLYNLLGK